MYNRLKFAESSAAFWDSQDTTNPVTLNGFAGTWDIKDHTLIPQALLDFINESFYGYTRTKRIPLEEINNLLNEVWDGPGSMSKIVRMTQEKRTLREMEDEDEVKDPLKNYETPTVDSELDQLSDDQ